MDQDSDKEVLSDDTGFASDSSEYDTNRVEKFVPSPEICAINSCTKHCMIQCYYTTGGALTVCAACMILLADIDAVGRDETVHIDFEERFWYKLIVMPYYDRENPAKKVFRDLCDKYMRNQLCYPCEECTLVDKHITKECFAWLQRCDEYIERLEELCRTKRPGLIHIEPRWFLKDAPIHARCYIEVPREIATKRMMISVRSTDNTCFACIASVVAALYPAERNAEWEYSYPHYTTVLNLTNIEFPMTLKDIQKFERLNAVSINVYDIENKQILPLWFTSDKEKHVNMLYMQDSRDDSLGHFAWIKNLSRLVSSKLSRQKNKKFFCDRCLHYFSSNEKLQSHATDCGKMNNCAIRLLSVDDKWLEFGKHCRSAKDALSYTYQQHEVFSIGYYERCSYDTLSSYRFRCDKDCIAWFARQLQDLAHNIKNIVSSNMPMETLSKEQ
ncbi:hypothetical protein ALC57_17664 [Trachymyrmex cornetzi]|uniref:C2H2-type domain-containing protein n=1 Tax=Trachymyrmex cornetzi TaxID=471704 RepID=A0A151ITI4_9HYME|nr:hypothetical protein ALC57_17664 [Trachymyrmex cornetzi]